MEKLICNENSGIGNLDLSNNLTLTSLDCEYTGLSSIDLSNNINLEYVVLQRNKLRTVDVSKLTKLRVLYINGNTDLAEIDVSNNVELCNLVCSFTKIKSLDFYEPDVNVFKGLKFAYDAGKAGGNMPVIFNAANEFAVAGFLKKEITFTQIYELIERAMDGVGFKNSPDLETVLETEREVYGFLTDYLRGSA